MIPIKKIQNFIKEKPSTHQIFNIVYNKKEKNAIQNFSIENHSGFTFKGNLQELIKEDTLQNFLESIGSNNKENITILHKIIYKLIKKVLLGVSLDHFWLIIRISLPHNILKKQRWHYDGLYFPKNPKSVQPKFITVLRGPGTLFIQNQDKALKIFNKIDKERISEMDQEINFEKKIKIDEKYIPVFEKDLEQFEKSQLKNNQGLLFMKNNNKRLIHSEPSIDKSRIFISIVPGTKENIEEIKKNKKIFI
jgi:hypothetical protein